jgi:predicted dehydrogenase
MGIAIHVLDTAHHFLGLTKPLSAVAGGGNYFFQDGRDTPDVCAFILDYPEKVTLMFESECLSAPGVRTSASTVFRGTGGVLRVERYFKELGYQYEPNKKYSSAPPEIAPGSELDAVGLLSNWVESIRSRNKPACSEVDGYYSAVACFMGAQAYKTRSRVTWDAKWDI